MNKFIKSMLSDSKSGEVSSKRVIGFLGFLFLAVTMVVNSFFSEEIAPSKELVSAVEFIVIASLFGTSIDRFARSNSNKNEGGE
jgi:hypothetical protein